MYPGKEETQQTWEDNIWKQQGTFEAAITKISA